MTSLSRRLVPFVSFLLIGCYDKPGSGDEGAEDSSSEGSGSESGSGPGTNSASTSASTTESTTASTTESTTASTTASTTDTTTGPPACVDTCAGCCDGEDCMPGDADAACGAAGGACSPCADHENCGDGLCALDPASIWTLTAVSAEILFMQDTGGPGSCYSTGTDAYLIVFMNMQMNQTSVIDENEMPVWNEALFNDSVTGFTGNMMNIQVWDSDEMGVCSEDDLIDSCAHQVDEAELEAGGFVIDFCGNAVGNLEFGLDPA